MGCCIGKSKKIRGNPIFRKLENKIKKCGNKELDDMFDKAAVTLTKAEEIREKLALKFKNMIVETGVCVLRCPTIERCISAFIVLIFIEICKFLKGNYEKIKEFNYSALIDFHSSPPFFSFNQNTLEKLKSIIGFELDEKGSSVSRAKKAIVEFIESLGLLREWFWDIRKELDSLFKLSSEFMKEIKTKLQIEGLEGISLGQAKDYIMIGEENIRNIGEVSYLVSIATVFIAETASTIFTVSEKILKPLEIMNLQKIAIDAVKRKIFDPKEIVFIYTKEEKCKVISDWEQNICYTEYGEEELIF